MEKSRGLGFLLGTALLAVLTGCTTYIAQPRPPTVYVPAPRVYVEPPRVYVPPPTVYVAPPASVPVPVVEIRAETDFYEPLSAYGHWETVAPHGRCWVPARVGSDWRPYSNGHWERTEAGWYWASDEPWAWATYHYGRWDFGVQIGWYWVPHTQWAPAWVSWHHGGGYVGWAPLQPSVRIAFNGAVEVNVNLIPQRAFVFVQEKRFLEPVRPTTIIVHNTTIINKTVNITNIKVVNNTIINEGPRTQIIEQVSGRKIQAVPIHELRRKEEALAVAPKPVIPPGTVRVEKVHPPIRSQAPPPERAELESDRRGRELHEKAHEESQRTARELEKKAQLESAQRARELQKQAQDESQRVAKELQRKAQLEAHQRAGELRQKANEETQKQAKELERKAQLESEQRARDLQNKAQQESQKAAKDLERKAQLLAEQRAWELHQKAHAEMQRTAQDVGTKAPAEPQGHVAQKQNPIKQRGAGRNKGQNRNAEEPQPPADNPARSR